MALDNSSTLVAGNNSVVADCRTADIAAGTGSSYLNKDLPTNTTHTNTVAVDIVAGIDSSSY